MLENVLEQKEAVTFLQNVIAGKFTSPLLLLGPEGTGKRLASLQVARALLCTGTKVASCTCVHCHQIGCGAHPDVIVISPEGSKDIGVAVIRALVDQALSYPSFGSLRTVILDGADRLTLPAANCILKTLEEPPKHTRFFLLAENRKAVLPTIESRCGLVRFRSLSDAVIVQMLSQFESDPTKALVYARISEGSVGRAMQYWGSGKLILRDKVCELVELASKKDYPSLFSVIDTLEKELPLVLTLLDTVIHDTLMSGIDKTRVINLDSPTKALSKVTLGELQVALRRTQERLMCGSINLPFHVKTAFVTAFGY